MHAKEVLKTYTLEEYFTLEETALEKHEYVNGKITEMPGGTIYHNLIAGNIITAMNNELRKLPQKFFVMGSDMKVFIPQKNQVRYPDALVICEKIETVAGRKDVIVNPLVIIEVLSDSTRDFDKTGKLELYQRIPSLKEYILIEQDYPEVTGFYREEVNLWRTQEVSQLNEKFSFRALGIEIELSDIYEDVVFEEK